MSKHCPLAVVGVSAIFPGSTSATGFWKDILEGRDLVQDIPEGHWLLEDYYDEDPSVPDMTYGKRGAFLEAVDFDAMGFGIPPSVIPTTDTSQLLALIVAQRVLDDATGGQFASMDKEKISVILGVTSAQELLGDMVSRLQHPIWRKALRDMGLPESQVKEACERISSHYVDWKESTFPGLLGNVVAGRIANRLDLHGTNCVTDAACASTLSALTMAAHELYLGEADMVITGGVDTMNGIFMHMCFSKTPALSATGDCRPFSADGDGTLLGEGLGMFALRRLEDAERDGDTIYAVLKGIGTSSDGRSKAVYAPVSEGQARALRRAYENADFDTRTVELVEAHGTGTRAGDAAEFGGLVEAFGATSSDDRRWCALGSVKSQIGHTKAAAGAAGLFKIVMALHHKVLPPTLKIEQPNPKMDLDNSPFYLNTEARPWVRGPDHARRAGVSSFGFGGSNFHVAVEAYEGTHRAARRRTWPTEMMLLSADSASDLATEARTWADKLGAEQDMAWASFATCRDADGTKAHRLAVVAGSVAEATKTLRMAADRISKAPDTAWSLPDGSTYASGGREGKTALLFPGQGSQYVRMGAELAMNFESAMQVWDASAAHDGDMALHDVVFPVGVFSDADRDAQSDQLRATEWAQPALGVSSAATLAVLKDLGVHADASAGHSFGELTALYAAGAMDLDTFCRASRARGRAVADAAASSAGSMLAVRLPLEQLEPLLEGQSDVVMANHNHPEQVVLSGPTDKVAEFERMLTGKEVVCKMLPVATAFHSHVVADAEGAFAKALKGVSFEKPSWTVYENATGKAYSKNIAKSLARQLVSPVRWVDSLEAMYADGVRTFIEVGAHGVLTGLTERTLGERDGVLAVSTDRKGRHGVTQLLAAVAQLWAHGVAIQPAALWNGYEHPLAPDARPKPKLAVPVDGNNIGKPYPPEGGAKALPAPNPEVAPPEPVVVERVVEKVVEVPVAMPSNQPPTMERMAMVSTATPRPAPAPVGDVWIDAFQAAQHEASEAHAAYQRTMADAHLGFLGAMSTGLEQLAALAGAPVTPRAPMATHAAPMMAPVAPVMPQPAVPTPVMTPASPAMTAAPPVLAPPKAAPAAPVLAAPAPSVVATPAPVVTPPAPAAVAVDLTAVMLGVVSEKTGYPQEMLSLEMDLEADLGIDSIKRVEILSAVREREPNLPDVDAAGMTSLRTLQEIVDYMTPEGGFAASAPVAAAAPAAMPAGIDVQGVMLAVVAEKTGYPQDMLSLEMDLEADLGIDSIKRVEILSAVREREPNLPDVDAAGMTTLRTLQEIVDYMGEGLPELAAPTAGVSAAGGATAVDVQGVMLEVVAEKTGYPVDMISLEMDLEADLGVDSIKRVEILSSVREREPNLPEVDAAGMTSLRTLQEIVDYMGAGLATAPAPSAPSSGVDVQRVMLEVVAEKTGYPVDMISLEMDLEADLGVDSIKRVEILSSVREREPNIPEVDAAGMTTLRTLQEIVEYMGGGAATAAPAPAAGASAIDVQQVMLEVVAEKTGYPVDMISLEMDLEADLGVDSIKRVEILSSVREREPNLPEVDAAGMTTLRTLQEIVDYMGGGAAAASAPEAATQAEAAPAPATSAAPGRWTVALADAPALGLGLPRLTAGKIAVTRDAMGVGEAMVAEMKTRGLDAVLVDDAPETCSTLVSLAGIGPFATAADAMAANRAAFDHAKAVAASFQENGGNFVTVQGTGGDFGLSGAGDAAWAAGLAGLAKTAALEWENATCRAIDIEWADRSAEALAIDLVNELMAGGCELEIGLMADGRRRTLVAVESEASSGELVLDKGDVVVVSGGARGVTSQCLRALAGAQNLRFVLLGRTPLQEETSATTGASTDAELKAALLAEARAAGQKVTPKELAGTARRILASREVRATLADLEAAGSEVRYETVNVTDVDSVSACLTRVRKDWGGVSALVHAAGVLADKSIVDKTTDQFDFVFNTKIHGLQALMGAMSEDTLKAVVFFSSVAARTGNFGQCDYAMANEVLNKVGHHLAAEKGTLVRSLGWGPWRGGMVTAALAAHFEQRGVPLIGLAEGAQVFVDELHGGDPTVERVVGGASDASALGASRQRELTLGVTVNARTVPQLEGHRVKGVPVVPVVMAAEWMARAACAVRPDLTLDSVVDIEVRSGIRVDDFMGAGVELLVSARQLHNGSGAELALELADTDGRVRYVARAVMVEGPARSGVALGVPDGDASGVPMFYDGDVIFHGSEFQVIREVTTCSDEGLKAGLVGLETHGWGQDAWRTDPAALDGAMQLVVLWAERMLGSASLPMTVGAIRVHEAGPLAGELTAVGVKREVAKDHVVMDITLLNEEGAALATLEGIKNVRLPNTTAARKWTGGARA